MIREQLKEYYNLTKETDALYSMIAEKSGMSDAMFWVLYALCIYDGGCTQRDICSIWAMSKQTVHSALKKLQKEGYILLEVMEEDHRSKRIRLTQQGQHYVESYIAPVFALEEEVFGSMSDRERSMLLESTRTFQMMLHRKLSALMEQEKGECV